MKSVLQKEPQFEGTLGLYKDTSDQGAWLKDWAQDRDPESLVLLGHTVSNAFTRLELGKTPGEKERIQRELSDVLKDAFEVPENIANEVARNARNTAHNATVMRTMIE